MEGGGVGRGGGGELRNTAKRDARGFVRHVGDTRAGDTRHFCNDCWFFTPPLFFLANVVLKNFLALVILTLGLKWMGMRLSDPYPWPDTGRPVIRVTIHSFTDLNFAPSSHDESVITWITPHVPVVSFPPIVSSGRSSESEFRANWRGGGRHHCGQTRPVSKDPGRELYLRSRQPLLDLAAALPRGSRFLTYYNGFLYLWQYKVLQVKSVRLGLSCQRWGGAGAGWNGIQLTVVVTYRAWNECTDWFWDQVIPGASTLYRRTGRLHFTAFVFRPKSWTHLVLLFVFLNGFFFRSCGPVLVLMRKNRANMLFAEGMWDGRVKYSIHRRYSHSSNLYGIPCEYVLDRD